MIALQTTTETYLYVGFAVFVLMLAVLGYLGWRKTETISDFAIAGETLGPYILGAAFAATFVSAATFVGYSAWAYDFGYSFLWIFLALISASPLALILFAKRVRRANIEMNTISLPDWIGEFYDSQFLRVGIALVLFFNLFYIAGQLSAGARIFQTMLGWDYTTGLAVIVVLLTAYVSVGGTYADVYTDAVQAVLMTIMGITLFVSVLFVFDWNAAETFSQISAELAAQDQSLVSIINTESIIFYSGFAILSIFILEFAYSAQPQLFNKVLALDDPKNLRKMVLTYFVLTVTILLCTFSGFYLRVLNPGVEVADRAIFIYAAEYFPAIVSAFLGVVILSAALSTTDGIYVVLATAISNDIFRNYLVKEGYVEMEAERADIVSRYIAQVSIIFISIIAFLIVRNPPPYIAGLVWIAIAGVGSATAAPIMVGIYFPNFATRKGAHAAFIIGVIGYIGIKLSTDIPSVMVEGTLGLILATVVMVAVSAITEQEENVAVFSEQYEGTGTRASPDRQSDPTDD